MNAKKSLGQNFLIDENIIKTIINTIDSKKDDLIIEIGPGKGALTKYLVNKSNVLCYEIDKDMTSYLDKYDVNVIYKDFLNTNIKEDIKDIKYNNLYIIGNLPYYITTPIIEHIIDSNLNIKSITIMVQKEVADRFMAKPKTKDYGYMSVLLQYYFDIVKVTNVTKNSFRPIPKVDSTVLKLLPKQIDESFDIEGYKKFLKNIFKYKRKTIKNNLSTNEYNKAIEVLSKYNIDINIRAEALDGKILMEIYNNIK